MKFSRILLTLFLILLIFCFLPAQNRLRNILTDEVLVVEGIEGEIFYQKLGLTTDPEGNIYITDLKGESIKKFDRIGKLVAGVGRRGEGQGEFLSPSLIKHHKGQVYVTDSERTGIQVFDDNLNFVFEIPILFTVSDLNVLSEDEIAVSALRQDRSEKVDFLYCLYVFDSRATEKEKIIYATSKSLTMMNMVIFRIDGRKNFVTAYSWRDKVEKFDRNGNLLWTRSLLAGRVAKTRKTKATKLTTDEYPLEIVYKAVTLDAYGNIFVLGGDLSDNRSRDVYVLNERGEHLLTFTLPEASHTIHIDSKNYLYSRSEDGKILRKYALNYIYE